MNDRALTADDFDEFFFALWGYNPFPWQSALARRVIDDGAEAWPEVMALPTAAGKTACIDVALFALACQAAREEGLGPSTAPRRIFFVVDRRAIVDEAFERSQRIAKHLEAATEGILSLTAERLRRIAGGEPQPPLACFQLRGGIYRDDGWARSPLQPTVICSTVDQIGSRLLFRAYGRSFRAWHLQAGLVGNDSLILLDEAHCAQPFMETLKSVERYRSWATSPIRQPFKIVLMSATPPLELAHFPDEETARRDRGHPVLKARIEAAKPCTLVVAEKAQGRDAAKANDALAAKLAAEAVSLIHGNKTQKHPDLGDSFQGEPAVAIFCNRVDVARRAYAYLQRQYPNNVVLLIGRMRPLDRDDTVAKTLKTLAADGSASRALAEPLIVVATQTLEVGANLDFDLMVSECADLSALRQRFGRLNRMGRPIAARGTIVVRADQQKPDSAPDPIYGNKLSATWAWLTGRLNDRGDVDLGIGALSNCNPAELSALASGSAHAPVMLPAHIDALAQTAPAPVPSPEISLFLHGPQAGPADVQVCWRADLVEATEPTPALADAWIDRVALCPPAAGELMPVPLMTFRRWLAGEAVTATDLGDLEGTEAESEAPRSAKPKSVLRWSGLTEDTVLIQNPSDVRPGDLIVIPSSLGGWETFGHIPQYSADSSVVPTVTDLGDRANDAARRKAVLRFAPATLDEWPDAFSRPRAALLQLLADAPARLEADVGGLASELKDALASLEKAEAPPQWTWLTSVAGAFAKEARLDRCVTMLGKDEIVIRQRTSRPAQEPRSSFSHEDDAAASGTVRWELADHLRGVAAWAGSFSANLPPTVAEDIKLAAAHHDLGKADPRFQALLHGGNRWTRGPLLAKSADIPQGRSAYLKAREASGYPDGARHELLSVRLLESAPAVLADAHDPDLVLHLIGSHHGHCRPFAPVVEDCSAPDLSIEIEHARYHWSGPTLLEELDSQCAERFWRLIRRYGWWGLAGLEAVLILADHRRSEWEERQGSGE